MSFIYLIYLIYWDLFNCKYFLTESFLIIFYRFFWLLCLYEFPFVSTNYFEYIAIHWEN